MRPRNAIHIINVASLVGTTDSSNTNDLFCVFSNMEGRRIHILSSSDQQ